MIVRRRLILLLLPVLFATLACPIKVDKPIYGPMDGDLFKNESTNVYIYRSQFFSFDLTMPGDWYPLSSKDFLKLMRKKRPDEDYSEEGVKKRGSLTLMSVSRYTPAKCGPSGESNPNIVVMAVDLSKYPGIKTAEDFIEWTKSQMKALGVKPISEPYAVQLSGVEFWRIAERRDPASYNALFVTIRKGYALMFVLTAASEADITELEEILKSIHFD